MENFLYILIWIGVGAACAVGSAIVIAVARVLFCLYDKIFNNSKEHNSLKNFFERSTSSIIISTNLRSSISNNSVRNLQLRIRKIREEYWKKDIVIPVIAIHYIPNSEYDFFIKLEGNVIFKDYITQKGTDEEIEDFIISKIESYFSKKGEAVNEQ